MKSFKTYDEQLDILVEKGLKIEDRTYAIRILKKEDYYNLINGYKKLFVTVDDIRKKERFKEKVTFEEIYSLYALDRELRTLILPYLLKFETNMKSSISYHFSSRYRKNHSYLEVKNYSRDIKASSYVLALIANKFQVIKSKGTQVGSIKHHLDNYDHVPLWVLMRFLTLGHVHKMYTCLQPTVKNLISKDFANEFNIDYDLNVTFTPEMLGATLKIINFFRNVSAHEERLHNFRVVKTPKLRGISNALALTQEEFGGGNLFSLLATLKLVLSKSDFEILKITFTHLIGHYAPKFKSVLFHEIMNEMGFSGSWDELI